MLSTLIVDNSSAELDVLLYLIQKNSLPLQPFTASNGEEAMKYLKSLPVDLLITDIRMPFMDGLALSEEALKIHPDLKIIIISGYQDFSYAKTAISLGVEEYLLKPISPDEFSNLILKIVAQYEEQKQNQKTKTLQTAYARDQITYQLVHKLLLPGENGLLPDEIRSIMPRAGKLILLSANTEYQSVLLNMKSDIIQLANSFFRQPARCVILDSQRLLVAIDYLNTIEKEDAEKFPAEAADFADRLQSMYGFPIYQASCLMPTPELIYKSVQQLTECIPAKNYEHSTYNNTKNSSSTSRIVQFLCDYISSHYKEDLSLQRLAETSYYNPDYLSRIFKKETGMNLSHYIKTFRLNKACQLLETTQQKVSTIASSVGYNNYAYFVHSFTEKFGMSPEKYRQQYNMQLGRNKL